MKKIANFRKNFKLSEKLEGNLARINLVFIIIFLNFWDFIISRELVNGMVLGLVMFGPAMLLWLVGTFRAVVLLTLISIMEFVVMVVFMLEGFELSGAASTLKSIFWLPYLIMAGINGFWGLKIYAKHQEKKTQI